MSDTDQKNAKILRDFTDAGTERRFAKGATAMFSPGEFENLRVAGLVEEAPDTAVAASTEGDAAKPGRARA